MAGCRAAFWSGRQRGSARPLGGSQSLRRRRRRPPPPPPQPPQPPSAAASSPSRPPPARRAKKLVAGGPSLPTHSIRVPPQVGNRRPRDPRRRGRARSRPTPRWRHSRVGRGEGGHAPASRRGANPKPFSGDAETSHPTTSSGTAAVHERPLVSAPALTSYREAVSAGVCEFKKGRVFFSSKSTGRVLGAAIRAMATPWQRRGPLRGEELAMTPAVVPETLRHHRTAWPNQSLQVASVRGVVSLVARVTGAKKPTLSRQLAVLSMHRRQSQATPSQRRHRAIRLVHVVPA